MSDSSPWEELNPDTWAHLGQMAEFGVLSASLLHELRQPLFAVKAIAQLARRREGALDDKGIQQLLVHVVQIEELLDHYAGYGQLDEPDSLFDLNLSVRRAIDMLAHRGRQIGADVEVRLTDASLLVMGRPGAARQVAVNLLQNALDAVAVAALDVLGADRAFVLLREDGELRVASSALAPEQPEGQPSMSVVQRCVAREGREVLAADLDERGELRGSDSMVALSLRSVLCVPIVLRTGVVGALYVDSRRSSEKVLSRAAWMLRALAGQAAAVVRTARRLEDSELRARRGAEFAHDVKGALNVVNLLAEELSELKLSEGAEAVADLEAVTGRLISMVHRFLADEQPSQAPLRLDRLVEQVLGPMSREAHRARRSLELDLCPAQVVGSREQLGRVLTNLVGNALKYATSRIHVSLAVEGDQAVLRVRDDGPGLPQDHASLFEAGVQAPGALPGQGLGLAIVQRMVWDHRGTVSARSLEPGAVFEVRLPLS